MAIRERVVFAVSAADLTDFFEWCRTACADVKTGKRDEKTGVLICSLPRASFARLTRETAISVTILRTVGLPVRLRALLRRPGLLLGALLALALIVASRLFLWEVRVTDSDGMTAEEVEAALAEIGVAPGAFLPRLDTGRAALCLRQADGRIGYAAVNLSGTVALVQIRTVKVQTPPAAAAPADLVAAEDGVILETLVFAGECLVTEGDVVRCGQILVRGRYTAGEEKETVRLTRAAGVVTAKTTHTMRIEVPFTYTVRQRTGRERTEATLIFFGARQKLFKTTGKYYDDCVIIEAESRLPVGGGRVLPVGLFRRTLYETVEATATRTEEEALDEARRLWAAEFGERDGRTVLAVRETVETAENGLAVTFVAVCEENIAVAAEIRP